MIGRLGTLEQMIAIGTFLIVAGCAAEPPALPLNLIDVQGTVSRNGEPAPRTIVMFVPVAAGGTRAKGITDQRGRYRLIHESDAPECKPESTKSSFRCSLHGPRPPSVIRLTRVTAILRQHRFMHW